MNNFEVLVYTVGFCWASLVIVVVGNVLHRYAATSKVGTLVRRAGLVVAVIGLIGALMVLVPGTRPEGGLLLTIVLLTIAPVLLFGWLFYNKALFYTRPVVVEEEPLP
jgi:hypothetical protein